MNAHRLVAALFVAVVAFSPAGAAPPAAQQEPPRPPARVETKRPPKPEAPQYWHSDARPAPARPEVARPETPRPEVTRRPGKPELEPARPAAKAETPRTDAPVVHLLAVAASGTRDTVAKKVGDDARNLAALFEESFAAAGKSGQLRTRVILGSETTASNVRAAIRGLAVRPQDTVVVFFSGHGGLDPRGRHVLEMISVEDVTTREVLDAVAAHNPRLAVLLTDVCHNHIGRKGETPPTMPVGTPHDLPRGRVIPWATVEQLFFLHRGVVDVTAAEPGRPGRVETRARGSYFTNALIQVLTAPHGAATGVLDRNGDRALQWAELLPEVRAVAGTRDAADNRYRDKPEEPQRATARALGTWAPASGAAAVE
ncbi:caspase family protein [bacterium]|nr:caspase family protein [bacterium]